MYAATVVCLILIVHNFGLTLLPRFRLTVTPDKIHPFAGGNGFAYAFNFNASTPQAPFDPVSRVRVYENGTAYPTNFTYPGEVTVIGGNRYSHQPGQVIFASTDNSDPRTNGRRYEVSAPLLYTRATGFLALMGFGVCLVLLYRGAKGTVAPRPPQAETTWRWHLWGATALLLIGLYCNTGSLTPYGITAFPIVDPATGYAFNQDHSHFRVLFDFLDGRDRSVWDHALFLRRILFPVLAWPFMEYFGFELGGAIASLLFSAAALFGTLCYLKRRIGWRGAALAGWLLALYPGAAYWGGLPYPYALIFPFSLLLTIGVAELASATGLGLILISLGMGTAYLGYDLAAFFLPAAVLTLLWRRRWGAAVLAGAAQALPTALWLYILAHPLGQALDNSNTSAYHRVVAAYLDPTAFKTWWLELRQMPTVGLGIFFGANFLFIPALFLAVAALNARTSRIRLQVADAALLLVAFGLFVFLNAAPTYGGGWVMRGNWIARLYQPIFPTLVFLIARWWQALPPVNRLTGAAITVALTFTLVGNALVVFGPILNNPGRVSEQAFYRFYNHTDHHDSYEAELASLGRRPLGFPRPDPAATPSAQLLAAGQKAVREQQNNLISLEKALVDNRQAYLATARGLAINRQALAAAQAQLARNQGLPVTNDAAKTVDDYLPAGARALVDNPALLSPSGGIAEDPKAPMPQNRLDLQKASERLAAANAAASKALIQAEADIGTTQRELLKTLAALSQAQSDLAHGRSR